MAAAYDNFDYPQYWQEREYEHASEVVALASFLKKIPKIHRIMDIGCGYGRLTAEYLYRANQVYLIDSSAKLLMMARKKFKKHKKIKFVHSSIENVKNKIKHSSIDVMVIIRVLHHVEDLEIFFSKADKYLITGGYMILEFPNKKNIKALIREFSKGNLTYPINIFPSDINKDDSSTYPFKNYHPDIIKEMLIKMDYSIIEIRSVSNIRNKFLKKHLPGDVLILFEKWTQRVLSYISFGPSLFILAQKNK